MAGTKTPLSGESANVIINSLEDTSVIDLTQPFAFVVPARDGTVTLAPNTNGKYAIDLTTAKTYPISGYPGYSFVSLGNSSTLNFVRPTSTVTITKASLPARIPIAGDIMTIFDLDAGIAFTPGSPICFFGDANVLTPTGYCRMDSLKVGDRVSTPTGVTVIEKIHKELYTAGVDTNPYIIPKGVYGAIKDIRISPRHRVSVDGKMIEARYLGLKQETHTGILTYYNLKLPNWSNMIVAGVTVESMASIARITISRAEFEHILLTKYNGKMTPNMRAKCEFLSDGSVTVPIVRS
jgi:hypothetical protein